MVYILSFDLSNFNIFTVKYQDIDRLNVKIFVPKLVKNREIFNLKIVILLGERDANKSFNAAYTVALKPHHGWIVQQAFYVGLKMVPDFNGFLDSMTGSGFEGDKVSFFLLKGSYVNFII